jgi:hypothetical protein
MRETERKRETEKDIETERRRDRLSKDQNAGQSPYQEEKF